MLSAVALTRAWEAAGLPVRGATLVDGRRVPKWTRRPTADEQTRADAILATFAARFAGLGPVLDADLAADLQSEAEIDAVPDAVLDLILAAKALPPTATAADVRARAKADRRAGRAVPTGPGPR